MDLRALFTSFRSEVALFLTDEPTGVKVAFFLDGLKGRVSLILDGLLVEVSFDLMSVMVEQIESGLISVLWEECSQRKQLEKGSRISVNWEYGSTILYHSTPVNDSEGYHSRSISSTSFSITPII